MAEISTKNSNKIPSRFFYAVFLPTAAVAVIVVFLVAYFSLRVQHKSYIERLETSWHSMSRALSASVWNYDLKAIESTIESYARVWTIKGIQVIDQYNTVLGSTGSIDAPERASNVLVMYGAGGSRIGEIRLWQQGAQAMHGSLMSSALQAALFIGLLLLLSTGFFWLALKRHILKPLEAALSLVREEGSEESDKSARQTMPAEFQYLAESIIQRDKATKDRIRGLRRDLNRELTLVNSLQSLLSESDQTCVVLGDAGQVLIRNISSPFSQRHLSILVDIVANTIDPVEGLTEAGFQVHRVFGARGESAGSGYEVVAATGETLMIKILRLQKSSQALVAYNVSHAKWSDQLVDELLGVSKSGLAIFDRAGRLQMEKGEPVARLLASHDDSTEINLARILLEFPKIGSDAEKNPVSFEHKLPDDTVYRVHFSQHERSGIGITHHNITEERKVEKHLIESQRLNDLGRIASGVAHDFNNSLGIVIGQLELAAYAKELSSITVHIETALSAANQSANVVKQLMTYSRKQPQVPEVVALDNIIESRKNVFQSAVGIGVTINYDLKFGGAVRLDVELFVSALLNLFINASDAMQGRGSILVTTQHAEKSMNKRRMMVLSIQDSGPGVPQEIQDEIFLPFFTTKKNNAGNGLGLSMVQGFVDQLAGQIRVENTDMGACFTLFLPEYQELPSSRLLAAKTRTGRKEASQIGTGGVLVLVDDNEVLLETNAQLLRFQNFNVKAFHDCLRAISFIVKADNIACVMVDMKMPQMSGLDFVDRISASIDSSQVILYSGNFDKNDITLAAKKGVNKLLRKPLTAGEILDAVRSCISSKRPLDNTKEAPGEYGIGVTGPVQ